MYNLETNISQINNHIIKAVFHSLHPHDTFSLIQLVNY